MPDDDDKHDPLEDMKKGFGLLFRAAKGAVEKLPTKDVEDAVVAGAREIGRAVESVGHAIEKQWKNETKKDDATSAKDDAPSAKDDAPAPPKEDEKKDDDKPAGGPRVG